ncbi:hypothetical protein GGR56DRAFT_279155 [Xylariaceae sp. FL0804]|nr:hypothetical protein GGR56DRAFT_279155 [Xylariaceae sp. FL0804]
MGAASSKPTAPSDPSASRPAPVARNSVEAFRLASTRPSASTGPAAVQASTPPTPAPAPARDADNAFEEDEGDMPSGDELRQIAAKSIQAGAVTGCAGVLFGAGSGIIRATRTPVLFAVVAGLQWFSLGSTYIASKSLLWHALGGEENLSRPKLAMASGVAGGVSGMVGGMFRGPSNILPGILFFGTLGASTSYLSNRFKSSEPKKEKTSWLDSRWSPLTRLTDEQYEEMLEEKLLRLRADMAIIDDTIASIKASQQAPAENDTEAKTAAEE